MGGGDLNMKKSWHPALLVNQEKVWKAEKEAIEEKKALQQLRKEREEERQLAELQRMQEASTGRKRVEKLDWMYAAPTGGEGMNGRFNERELEDYLLGKKRVDEVLRSGDKDVGNTHKDFIAVQNANSARDTAAKIREDPMLAMKKAEQAALQALMNRPDVRRQLKARKEGGGDGRGEGRDKESKEERRRRREEKERRREERHRRRSSRSRSRSPRRHEERSERRRRDDESSRSDERRSDDRRSERRHRERSSERSDERSERRNRDRSQERRRRDSPRRDREVSPPREKAEPSSRPRDERDGYAGRNGRSDRSDDRYEDRRDRSRDYDRSRDGDNDARVPPPRRPETDRKPYFPREAPRHAPPPRQPPAAQSDLDAQRAARLAAMTQTADQMYSERAKKVASREEEERKIFEREQAARARYHKDEAAGMFMKNQEQLGGQIGLADSLQRRGGRGLLKDI